MEYTKPLKKKDSNGMELCSLEDDDQWQNS
jgi:hypothetical protein